MGTLIFSIVLVLLAIVGLFFIIRPVQNPAWHESDNRIAKRFSRIGGATAIIVAALLLIPSSVKSVGATEVGVPITLGQPGQPLGPGPHLVLPWTDVVTLDVKTQNISMDDDSTVKTVTVDRVVTPIDVVIYYHVDNSKAPSLLLTVGQDYADKIVAPQARSAVYDVGSRLSSENIQSKRDDYEAQIEAALGPVYAARGIILEKVEIKRIQLPENIVQNAEAKINAEEQLKRAKIDADTKVVEAEAQARANKIIADSAKSGQDAEVCQLLLVQALAEGKITGPLYINPCGTSSGQTPLITKSTN
jgi:regulator of protease activity HflC (stomatin/prohibitin superfamily)